MDEELEMALAPGLVVSLGDGQWGQVATLGEFMRDPGGWVDTVHDTGLVLLVTHLGRFVTMVSPVDNSGTVNSSFVRMVLDDGGLADQMGDPGPL